ncbi:Cell wall protein [Yarrowia sp. C11]|nr:Cell wall protein [Yarrowia sp. E02]KAG5369344.1 Cell wall protein [Yarrowia sp. C11]
MQFSYALLAALVALASAQSSTSSASNSKQSGCSDDVKVESQADLDKIAGCKKLDGTIEITGEAGVLSIEGIEEITGSLIANNLSSLNSLTAPKLTSVGKDLDLQVLNGLSTLSFPALQAVGNLKWITLPNLDVMQLNQGVNNATSVVISDTSIKELMGINVVDVGEVNINNNRYLKQIALGLQHVTESLQISDNAPGLEAQFDSLQWAANISFRGVSRADLPNLTYVNNSIGYVNNTIKNISLPQLTKVGGGIFFVSNSELTDLKVPQLEEIGGGLQVANNTKLRKVDGFPKVKSVAGAIEMLGNFSEATLPKLNQVKGGVDVESNDSGFNCSSWNDAHSNGDIQGDSYQCSAKESHTSVAITATSGGSSSSPTGSSGSSGSSSGSSAASSSTKDSKNSANTLRGAEIVAGFGAGAAILIHLL